MPEPIYRAPMRARDRDVPGAHHLGRITGELRQVPGGETGLDHVRDADWIAVADDEVPGAVRATFARGGRNLQRTHDAAAERRTAELWAMRRGSG